MKLLQILQKILKPKPKLNLVEWADTYRYLSSESSSLPGKWRTDQVEVARGPMLAITDPRVRRVSIMACTQLLKSSILENVTGYYAHQDPSPIILVQPTVTLAEAFGKDRIDKMFRDSPELNGLLKQKKSRDANNTLTYKAFPGGYLALVGSNSPTDLSSRPIRVALLDEVDKYPPSAGKEGDVLGLVTERTATFFDSKVISVCSPTIDGLSRIASEYELGDKRVFEVPCPNCGVMDEMIWDNVRWPKGKPELASYVCVECDHEWSEPERIKAISLGSWKATAEFKGHASFRCSKLVSPWEPLSVMARKWEEAQGNPQKLKVFVNTQLAETWVETGEAPDYQRLYERVELYPQGSLSKEVVFLTAGADIQKDRIEVEVVGWGRDKQSWSVDYFIYEGDTAGTEVWKGLDKLLSTSWKKENDERDYSIVRMCVDSGYNTSHVYNWVRKQAVSRVSAIKGSDGIPVIVGIPSDVDVARDGSRLQNSLKVWPVGVSVAKSELYGWLKLDKPETGKVYQQGYCHFPQYSLEHFKRLCSEQLMKRIVKNRVVYRWELIHERNEQLDCRNYARAAAAMYGMDRFTEKDWDLLVGRAENKISQQTQTTSGNSSYEPIEKDDNYWSRHKDRKLF